MNIDVVAALILKNGRIFATQRGPQQSHPLCWEFPGGKVEQGETHEEALARELYEELGVHAHPIEFIETRETLMPDRTIRVHLYRTLLESDDFHDSEHAALDWITLEQARTLQWTQADAAFLDDVEKILRQCQSVYTATPSELDGIPVRAAGPHIFRAIQRPWDAATNPHYAIGHKCQKLLETRYDCRQIQIADEIHADDGTTRIIYELTDGARVETVHMPRNVKNPRVTLCISSQVGCPMNCAFCATATLGLRRNLTAAEIVQQVILAVDKFGPHQTHAINIVFMGMGEALMNTENVLRAIDILTHDHGLHIPPVRMTLSTSGILSEFDRLKNAPNRPNLAISINATTDEIRSQIMPVNRRFSLGEIHQALVNWPYRSHEKILLEYVLLQGINDTIDDAKRLAEFARDLPHNINIIPYNETPRDKFHAPTQESIQQFIKILQDLGCLVTLRVARGVQVGGACGQLLAKRQRELEW